ncbi:MAG: hypothetical protein RIS29_2361 [Bacteroidota bacterium]|jgi:rhamnosyltransferase
MKILGIVTAYYPNTEEFIRNIKTYVDGLDQLIIWDNSIENNPDFDEAICQLNIPTISIRRSGNNDFLAKPFNTCIKEILATDYTYVLTMDQDSYFEGDGFYRYLQKVAANSDPKVMLFCPAKTENTFIDLEEVEESNTITSGTIYKLEIFEKIGFFREDFLIYMIDIEFGMRVKKHGYKILCYPRILLNHFTGYAKTNKLGWRVDNYSAQSTYYIIRNVILNWSLYPDKFSRKEKLTFYRYKVGYRTIKIFLEPKPIKKLKAIYLGVFHGITGKSGVYTI